MSVTPVVEVSHGPTNGQKAVATPKKGIVASSIDLMIETIRQSAQARADLDLEVKAKLRVPWHTVYDVAGPMLPDDVWITAASSGNGKTTLLMSAVHQWVLSGLKVYVVSLEESPILLRRTWAALASGLYVRAVREKAWDDLPPGAKAQLQEHLQWQADDGATLCHFSRWTSVSVRELAPIYYEAQAFGADVIVLDHLHEVIGALDYGMLGAICKTLKRLAQDTEIPTLAAAQLRRGEGDLLAPYRPPRWSDVQGGDIVRQRADVVLGAYRPLIGGVTARDVQALQQGQARVKDYLRPHCVGMNVLKHRTRGDTALGELMFLAYDAGLIHDAPRSMMPDPEDRYDL